MLNYRLPHWLSSTDSASNTEDENLIPGLGRYEGWHDNPLLYYCLENLVDREAWWAIVHMSPENRTGLKQLSKYTHT